MGDEDLVDVTGEGAVHRMLQSLPLNLDVRQQERLDHLHKTNEEEKRKRRNETLLAGKI